jgi:thiamine-phosphate pyrophosphorylase
VARPLPSPPVLLITDRSQTSRPLAEVVAAAFDGGCRWVSLREKDLPSHERRRLVEELQRRAEPYKARIGVHNDVALAASLGLRALHLATGGDVAAAKWQADPRCLIGRSAHNAAEVVASRAAGADYVTLSPIFLTQSKPGYGPAVGIEILAAVAKGADLPIVALGGLTAERIAACRAAGAKGVAVMGEAMRADDPARVMRGMIYAWQKASAAPTPP